MNQVPNIGKFFFLLLGSIQEDPFFHKIYLLSFFLKQTRRIGIDSFQLLYDYG